MQVGAERVYNLLAFTRSQAACIDKDAGELGAYGFMDKQRRDS